MTRLAIEQVSGDELRGNVWLRTELSLLAAPSHDEAAAILAREVAACTHLYLGRDASGQLAGFLMTRREVSADDESLLLVHLGWSVCRTDRKNSGATVALFERWIVVIRDRERRQRFHSIRRELQNNSTAPACIDICATGLWAGTRQSSLAASGTGVGADFGAM